MDMTRVRRSGRLLLGAALLCVSSASAQEPPTLPEYTVKAGFIFNFAKYVEWPADAFEKADSPIMIGIVGADPFGEGLEKTSRGKTVRSRTLSVRRFRDPSELQRVHLLFIPRTEKGRLPEILKHVESWPVLTVGEDDGFTRAGGATNILIEKEKPRLEVNPEAAEKARLTIDQKLLKVATIVRTGK
jgi:hypothetical protein